MDGICYQRPLTWHSITSEREKSGKLKGKFQQALLSSIVFAIGKKEQRSEEWRWFSHF